MAEKSQGSLVTAMPRTACCAGDSQVPQYERALKALEIYLEVHPRDPTANWLRRAIMQKRDNEGQPWLFAGKLPYVMHYRLDDFVMASRCTANDEDSPSFLR